MSTHFDHLLILPSLVRTHYLATTTTTTTTTNFRFSLTNHLFTAVLHWAWSIKRESLVEQDN